MAKVGACAYLPAAPAPRGCSPPLPGRSRARALSAAIERARAHVAAAPRRGSRARRHVRVAPCPVCSHSRGVLCCCSLSLSLLAAGTVSKKLKEQLSARLAAFDLAAAVAGAEPGGDGGGDDDDDDDDAEPPMAPSTGWPPPPPPPPPTGGAAAIMV